MQDGVYLGLPHADYLAVPDRLGSTDFTKLFAKGAGWWWTSKYNPHYVEPRREPMIFGSALHSLVLEGREAFDRHYAVKPNPREYRDLLVTAPDLHGALEAAGAPGLRAKMPKAELVQLARAYLKDRNVWDDIVERWARTARGRQAIDSGDAFALEAMLAGAMEDADMAEVLNAHGGVKLVEVSVFWTCPLGLKKRYRFDSLLPTANVDLKSVFDGRSRPFAQAAADRIRFEHLNVQLAMSHEARLAMYQLIQRGDVFATSQASGERLTSDWENFSIEDQKASNWLHRFPAEAPLKGKGGPGWCWLWLFYQKPEGGAAPTLLPLRVLWGDDLHRSGWRKLRLAEQTYIENVKRFGLNKPWTQVSRVHDTSDRAANHIRVIEYDAPMQQPGEGEAMEWRR